MNFGFGVHTRGQKIVFKVQVKCAIVFTDFLTIICTNRGSDSYFVDNLCSDQMRNY